MELRNTLSFSSREQWREWLAQNHDKEKEVWLIHFKKNSGKKSVSYREALEEALCFGWIDGIMKSVDNERFALRYSPRKGKSLWSKANRDLAEKLIKQGKMAEAGLARIEDAKVNGLWDAAYTNKTRRDLPGDLKNALLENKTAWNNFTNFANSHWNAYIYWVDSAKTEATRKRRIAEVVGRSLLKQKSG